MEDWRLRGQEDYLAHATLYRVKFPEFWRYACEHKHPFYLKIAAYTRDYVKKTGKWSELAEGDDIRLFWHEHCEFCWAKACTDTPCEFYCTEDLYYWVCAECVRDFAPRFHWQVKSMEELPGQATVQEASHV